MITPFDLMLILIVFSFVLFGLWFGLVHAIGGIVGTVIGVVVAIKYYAKFASTNLGQVIAFIILFTLGSKITGFVFYGIEKALKLTHIIPGIKTINRFAGGILGLVEGIIIIGVILVFATRFSFPALMNATSKSEIAQFVMGVGSTVIAIFPGVLKNLKEATVALPE